SDPARVFSPYCWRARMALLHKGLPHESLPWRFTEKAAIADAGTDKVPVLRDGARVVHDSWAILEDLEDRYPGRASLFGGEGGRALARFVAQWADTVLNPAIAGLIVSDIPALLDAEDRAYFVRTREARFGKPLAEVTAGREARLEGFRAMLLPLRRTLSDRPFLHGATPGAGDYIAFSGFQWARVVSPLPLLAPDDVLHAWRGRLLDAFGGVARAVPAAERG
ncbi:MAG: glutathione S-transferase family protein, partial [Roseomonas mucosa]|nr:glutathione S-transferase family protein [Roseomonas mucosa]